MPTIIDFIGIAFGIMFCYLLYLTTQMDLEKNYQTSLVVGIGACAIAFMTIFGHLATNDRVRHHKRILQKHGLWQDEEIKKKDLPKTEGK